MTEPCILCGDIHVPTEKSVQHRNDLNYQRTLHPLWGHSNPDRKRQFSIEMITRMTKPYFICWDIQIPVDRTLPYIFVGTCKVQLKKTVQYRNDFKDDRILHPFQEHSVPTEKDCSVSK